MRALLISVGSRGDAEPLCALAQALVARGHEVDLFLQTDLKYLAPALATVRDLPFTQMDFYKFVGSPSHGADHENPRVRFIGVVADVIAELVLPCCDTILESAKGAQVIVASSLARPLAMAVSQKLGISSCIIHLQPLAPTDKFPHSSNTESCVAAIIGGLAVADAKFEESYWELEEYQHKFLQDRLDSVYCRLGLAPLRFDENFKKALLGQDGKTLIANAFSGELIPSVHNESSTIYDVGPLAEAYIAADWNPPGDLVSFLDNCEEPPVCVGYGSMPFDKATLVLEALEELNRKAVLVGDALKVDSDSNAWVEENVFGVASAPYPWLLPRCSMMLSHGGAGVVNATLRAGIPCVISPLMGDQFFWAKLLEAKKIGVQAGALLTELSKEDLISGIGRADSCRSAAKDLGEKIRSKGLPVDQLVQVLENMSPN